MTTPSHITASLSLSKELYEAGIKIDSYFWWSKAMDGKLWRVEDREFFAIDRRRDIPAPLASELGELLPHQYHVWFSDGDGINGWCCVRFSEPELDSSYEHWETADTMPNVIAKMLIYLKEQGEK